MNIVAAIFAGVAGTAAMTVLMMMAPKMGMPEMDVMSMLGSMVSQDAGRAKAIGAVIHFMMGAVFGIVYALLWSLGLGGVSILWGLIFGAVHGLAAGVMMPMMTRMMQPATAGAPSENASGGVSMMMGLLMGHMLFGLVVALIYGALL